MPQPNRPAGLRLFRLFGIDVYLHWMWALALYLAFQWSGEDYNSPVWVIAECLTLFLIVLLHEFGHALACKSVGGEASHIMLWPLGGVAYVNPPPRPAPVLWSIAAGPLVNVILAPITIGIYFYFRTTPISDNLYQFLRTVALINIGLLIFNLLPIYPLDGGQIFRSLLWFIIGRAYSLMVATVVGLIGAAGLGLLALHWQDWWLGILAIYAASISWQGLKQAQALRYLAALPRRAGLACPHCHQPPPVGEFWRCEACGNPFDTFATAFACPRCGHVHLSTTCVDCGRKAAPIDWQLTPFPPPTSMPASSPSSPSSPYAIPLPVPPNGSSDRL